MEVEHLECSLLELENHVQERTEQTLNKHVF